MRRAWQREVIAAAAASTAAHYRLALGDVWLALDTVESEFEEETGETRFGVLLESPRGVAALGVRLATELLGYEQASALPPPIPGIH